MQVGVLFMRDKLFILWYRLCKHCFGVFIMWTGVCFRWVPYFLQQIDMWNVVSNSEVQTRQVSPIPVVQIICSSL